MIFKRKKIFAILVSFIFISYLFIIIKYQNNLINFKDNFTITNEINYIQESNQ